MSEPAQDEVEVVTIQEHLGRTFRLLRNHDNWTVDDGDGTLLHGNESEIMAEWTRLVRELKETA